MKFSYKIDQQYILKDIDLPLQPGTIYLIAGQESKRLHLTQIIPVLITRNNRLSDTYCIPDFALFF